MLCPINRDIQKALNLPIEKSFLKGNAFYMKVYTKRMFTQN